MRIWSNGEDWIVSETLQGALAAWKDRVGEDWVDDWGGSLGDWEDVTEQDFSIWYFKDESMSDVPSTAKKHKHENNEHVTVCTASGGDWIVSAELNGWWFSVND